jgi:hypothetical protein
VCEEVYGREGGGDVLLMAIGGVLPQAFMRPPRKMGVYLMSHCLKAGEFWLRVLVFLL